MPDPEYADLAAHDAAVNADIRDKTPSDRVSVLDDATIRRKTAATVFNNKSAIAGLSAPDAPDLIIENNTLTTGDQAGTIGKLHVLTIAGLTANRSFTLPTSAATGERVGVYIKDGDPTYEILIKSGAAGDLIQNVDHSSTEWTRLFTVGEKLVFRCLDGATVDWMVETDGRVRSSTRMTMSTNITTNSAATWKPIDVDTIEHDVGAIADTSNKRVNIRRAGTYNVNAGARPYVFVTAGNYYQVAVWDGTTYFVQGGHEIGNDTSALYVNCSTNLELDAGIYLEPQFICQETNKGCLNSKSGTYLAVTEQL